MIEYIAATCMNCGHQLYLAYTEPETTFYQLYDRSLLPSEENVDEVALCPGCGIEPLDTEEIVPNSALQEKESEA